MLLSVASATLLAYFCFTKVRSLMLQSRGAQSKSSKEHHKDGGVGRAKAMLRRPIVENCLMLHICQKRASFVPKKGEAGNTVQELQRTSIKMEENVVLGGLRRLSASPV